MNIVILTGAGISSESGLATFRGNDGLWEGHRIEDVCTADALARNPEFVCSFYDERRLDCSKAEPNPAHRALARLERYWLEERKGQFLLITQNIDDLHERAGSLQVLHIHGELNSAFCIECGWQGPRYGRLEGNRECPSCEREALRPDIVLFGEASRQTGRVENALDTCGIFVAIGTSGTVYPAAGFAEIAKSKGAKTLQFNAEEPANIHHFDMRRRGPASKTVAAWVNELITRGQP